jgi:RsiW-degrading membrane proteinase PrsW (M82 family)
VAGLQAGRGSIQGQFSLVEPTMSVTAQTLPAPASRGADLRLAVIGATTVTLSIAAFAAGYFGALPSGLSTALVILGMGMALKLMWTYVARSASSASRVRVGILMSNIGLGISVLAALAALPRLTKTAGVGLLLIDLLAYLWTLALLTAAAGAVRTLGWRAYLGAFLLGFLGVTGLARFLGRPLILALGTSSVFAAAIWVPLTEELCKMLPVILLLVLALRRRQMRPSLLDLVLIGAWAGAGFAVYEDATYGRGGFSLTAIPILSLIFPATLKGSAFGWSVAQTGHMVHTALIALGIGFAVLYRHRQPRSWIVAATALGAALIEHCSQNAINTGGVSKHVGEALLVVSLNGRLSAILLVVGIAYVLIIEWRAVGGRFRPRDWLQLPPAEIQRRGALLAALQTRGAASIL